MATSSWSALPPANIVSGSIQIRPHRLGIQLASDVPVTADGADGGLIGELVVSIVRGNASSTAHSFTISFRTVENSCSLERTLSLLYTRYE